jgi:hypothetical protein
MAAWSQVMVSMLRTMVGDTATTQVFTDDDLELKLCVAAMLIKVDITFDVDYTIDVYGAAITPDPSTSDPADNSFMSLVCIKAACIMERGEAMALTKNDVQSVTDNGFSIKVGNTGANKIAALKVNWCAAYDKAKADYMASVVANGASRAVISPFAYMGGQIFNSRNR